MYTYNDFTTGSIGELLFRLLSVMIPTEHFNTFTGL